MGKDKTDTDLICPNAQNDRNKSVNDKENSIETKGSKSIIKVRKDLTEVLEDENANDSSNTSTKSKSNRSSSPHTSSSTSKEDSTSDDLKTKNKDSKKAEETDSKSTAGEESSATKLSVASNNPTQFKLRIVPLEKLLERPPKAPTPPLIPAAARNPRIKKENLPTERSRRLPQRRSKPVSFIELSSDSDEELDLIISSSSESEKRNKSKKQEALKRKSVRKSSESEEEEPKKSASKQKTAKESSNSDSEEDDVPLRSRKSNRKPDKKSSDSEGDLSKKTATKKKPGANSNKKSDKKVSDSEEEKPKRGKSKRRAAEKSSEASETEEEEPKKSALKKKTAKKALDSEEGEPKKASSRRNPDPKSDSEGETNKETEEEESKEKSKNTSSKEKPVEKSSSDSGGADTTKASSKKKAVKTSTDSEEGESKAEEDETAKSSSKRKADNKLIKTGSKEKPVENSSDSEEAKAEPVKTSSKKKADKKSTDPEEVESISSLDAEDEDESTKTSSKKKADNKTSIKISSKEKLVEKSSDSAETEPAKTSSKKKADKKSTDSEEEESKTTSNAEEDEPAKTSSKKKADNKSTKKASSKEKPVEKSSDSEEEESKTTSDAEEDEPAKASSKKKAGNKSIKTSSKEKPDSEEEESKTSSDAEEDEPAKSRTKNKADKKPTLDEDKSIKSASSKRKRFEKSSESEEDEATKTRSKRSAHIKTSVSEKDVPKSKAANSSNTEIRSNPRKPGPRRKTIGKDTEETSKSESEEDEPKKSVSKKKTADKPESDKDKAVKPKSKLKSKASAPPPPPSATRRCSVRVKRSKLSDFKDIVKSKSKRKMNGGTKSEKPSTSSARRRHVTSDDDSDVSYKRAANIDERLADHDYDGLDVEDDENDDDNDSQKSSDSEIIPTRKRRVFRKDKDESNNSDSDFELKQKDKKKRRRVRRNSSDDSDDDDDDEKKKIKRKDIRKIIKSDDLNVSTKEAAKEEEERRKRIEERQKIYNKIYEKPDSTEVTDLVLDFDPESKKVLLEVDKGLVKKLKPHQVTGVKFMWDACFETLPDAQEKSGSGCILAHCMGLGKTMQIVTLSHTLLSNSGKTSVERVLIISPLSTLNNWAREFKQWIGFTKKRNIEIYDISKYKDKQTRIFKLNEWYEEGGVCIMGYDMYRILSNEKAKGLRKKQREQVLQSLVDPGPDMVVCDEGHLLKNEKTSISKAVTRMRTLRRIVLTGTPLQNNLKEYYCMIQFIKPNLLGTYKEYLNRFVNPISNGQYTDSTDRDIRLMKHRSHILHKLLEGCIQRRDYSVLAPYLPPKHEYVVYTTLSMLQQLLYEHYMVNQRDSSVNATEAKGAKLFQDFQELRRIWTHPMNMRINSDSVIRKKVLADDNDSIDDFLDDDNDDDDAASSSNSSDDSSKSFASAGAAPNKTAKTRNFRRNAVAVGEEVDSDIEEVQLPQQDDPSEWWKRFVADKELNNINHSPKLVILMRLLEQCEAIGDKLLVFSQSLQSLDTIEHFLSLVDSKTRGHEYEGDVGEFRGFWNPGTDYFRLDGSCSVEQRESMCKKFNDTSNLRSRLFLISTRAGGLGINLVSANRVVIFDVSWNPSHDTQSIFRVYRFGQDKPCYIYRLIAMGTMEQKLYERQVAKQATAKRVIDEQQISRHYNQSDLQELYTYELQPSTPREIPILPKDRLFAELLTEHESFLFKYHEHDSLLENEESENLSADERQAAWSEYEAEKTRTVQTAQYMSYDRSAYGQFGNSSGSVTSNKIFGFRSDVLLQLLNLKITKDHPEMTQNQVIQVVPTYLNQLYSQMNSGDPSMYKDLLTLHATLVHPSGMYMNPLLYVNQNPSAAGYFQAGAPPANGVGGIPIAAGAPMGPPPGVMAGPPIGVVPAPAPVGAGAAGFDPNEVYEID